MHNIEVVHCFYNMPLRNVLVLLKRKLRWAKQGLYLQGYWQPWVSSCKHVSQKAEFLNQLAESVSYLKIILVFITHLTNAILEGKK